jgi:hypothetical protein
METSSKIITRTHFRFALFLIAGLMFLSGAVLADESEKRLSVTTQTSGAVRGSGIDGIVTQDEFGALVTTGDRTSTARSIVKSDAQSKAGVTTSNAPNIDFWFYSADVILFNDHDNDGFFYGIDLLFDADTYFDAVDVYAVVYLSYEGGPWNEYAATENFTIFSTSADDEYVIVTELLEGYPSGSYDLLIELFDAYDDSFLAYFGPEDTSELAFLALEDAEWDTPIEVPEVIVVHEHGGGALDWLLLLAMAGTALLARLGALRSA